MPFEQKRQRQAYIILIIDEEKTQRFPCLVGTSRRGFGRDPVAFFQSSTYLRNAYLRKMKGPTLAFRGLGAAGWS